MPIQRITAVKKLVIGETYLVPCLRYPDSTSIKDFGEDGLWMPILEPGHIDPENVKELMDELVSNGNPQEILREEAQFILRLCQEEGIELEPQEHYHVDIRFTAKPFDRGTAFSEIIADVSPEGKLVEVESEISWKKKKCTRIPVDGFENSPVPKFYEAGVVGKKMEKLICPHQKTSLAGVPINAEGIITCPAHGLQWCTKSGNLQPRKTNSFNLYAIVFNPDGRSVVKFKDEHKYRIEVWENSNQAIKLYFSPEDFETDRELLIK